MRGSLQFVVAAIAVLALAAGSIEVCAGDPPGTDFPGEPVKPQPGDPAPRPKPPKTQPPRVQAPRVQAPKVQPPPHCPPPVVSPPLTQPAPKSKPKRRATPDRVRLKDGQEWVGRIVQDDARGIRLERVSATGGVMRVLLPRDKIATVQRGRDQDLEPVGSTLVRNEWFLLHSDGRVVGTRNLRVSKVLTSVLDGWRVEEEILEFAQGPRLPATRIRTVEVTDKSFRPVLIDFRETAEGAKREEDRYDRRVSGKIVGGVWSCARVLDGSGDRSNIVIPEGVRGRLGHREHLLRQERRIGLYTDQIVDAAQEGVVEIRGGFVSVADTPDPRGDEFHWHASDRRLISFFTRDHRAVREEIAEGVLAMPASEAQCQAASESGKPTGASPKEVNPAITLPQSGISFRKPGPTWQWEKYLDQPANTGERALGILYSEVLVANARIEWHPESFLDAPSDAEMEASLLHRLRGLDASLTVVKRRAPISKPRGAWRMDIRARLKGDNVRTAVIVIDRRPGRSVILFACPVAAWAQGEAALQNFLNSLEPI